MSAYNNFYGQNQGIMNQLLRQRDNVENMINQYSQMPSQPPIQNIINQGGSSEFEARILKDDEELENIFINKKTMFLDKKNKRLVIKEIDGNIVEQYEIVIPKDEKDLTIENLQNKLKEMEEKINEYQQFSSTNIKQSKSNVYDNEYNDTTTKTNGTSISKKTK